MIDFRIKSNSLQIKDFSRKFDRAGKQIFDDVFQEMLDTGKIVVSDIRKSMRRTPRASWSYARGGGRRHSPSKPFHPPAIDSKRLYKSLVVRGRRGNRFVNVEFGSRKGAPYAVYLEEGTRSMKKRPFLFPAWQVNRHPFKRRVSSIIAKRMSEIAR